MTCRASAEGRLVSGEFFHLLGVQPAFGRLLTDTDTNAATPAIVLSHQFWRTTLQADPAIVGSSLDVNGRKLTVAGIAARSFVGIEPSHVDIYLPLDGQPGVGYG
jgi:hypothetical protein